MKSPFPVYLIQDPDGWIHGTRIFEGEPPADAPASHALVEDIRLAHNAGQAKGLARLHPNGRELMLPQDDRQAWRLLRAHGRAGHAAHGLLARIRELRARVPGDLPRGITLPPLPAPRALATVPHDFADVPGLAWRPVVADDLDRMAAASVEAGLHAATCPPESDCGGCEPPEAHPWLMLARRIDNPDAFAMALEFRGEPLQFEIVKEMEPGAALFSYTVHLNRERPGWFWREAERPIIEGLQRHGVTDLRSATYNQRPDWIQALKDNYGAVEAGAWDPLTTRLDFPLDLGRFTGWPARKSNGVGWEQGVGRAKVVEGTAADLPAVRALLAKVWATLPERRALTQRMLEEWWTLDRASLLLGVVGGELRDARLVRPRRGGLAAVGMLSPAEEDPAQDVLSAAHLMWQRAAGYDQTSMFVPAETWDNPKAKRILARQGWRMTKTHTRFKVPFTEVVRDLPADVGRAVLGR